MIKIRNLQEWERKETFLWEREKWMENFLDFLVIKDFFPFHFSLRLFLSLISEVKWTRFQWYLCYLLFIRRIRQLSLSLTLSLLSTPTINLFEYRNFGKMKKVGKFHQRKNPQFPSQIFMRTQIFLNETEFISFMFTFLKEKQESAFGGGNSQLYFKKLRIVCMMSDDGKYINNS